VPIDRSKYKERDARVAAFLERSRELIKRSARPRGPGAAAAARTTETAVTLADDERKRALERATAALKAARTAAAAPADINTSPESTD
jgi:hypothetical protein